MLQHCQLLRYQVVQHTDALLTEVASQGKNFKWNRPSCPCGSKKVWGHGFVARYFDGFPAIVYLKRYRCPSCRTVYTMLPKGFVKYASSSVTSIWATLRHRLTHYFWPKKVPRQRAGHWLRRFLIICCLNYPEEPPILILDRLERLSIHLFSWR